MSQRPIASYIDHTILSPLASLSAVTKICEEVKENNFASACIPPYFVPKMRAKFGDSIKIATVIGFPFGYSHTLAKKMEIEQAINDGVDEIDMVVNIAAIKNQDWEYLKKEIHNCMTPIRRARKVIKIIIESGMLTNEEIIKCCELYGAYKIDYLKTSTGYAEKGASEEAVALFKKHLPEGVKIKASGGIRDKETALKMIALGAEKIGASAGLEIIKL